MSNIVFFVLALVSMIYILNLVRNNKFGIYESMFWVIGGIIMMILSIFPQILDRTSLLLGISYPPSLLFIVCIIFLLFINFRNSKKITEQQEKIVDLCQNIAILKNKSEK